MTNIRIKDLPLSERPYEKFIKRGEDALSDAELLALILRSGVSGVNITDICKEIISLCDKKGGIGYLGRVRFDELLSINGIGKVKAAQIKCLGALCQRMWEQIRSECKSYKSAEDIALYYMQRIKGLEHEETMLLFVNSRKQIFNEKKLSIGSVDRAILSCREIFKSALLEDAAGIVIMHNHPSGDPQPSTEDKLITQVINKAGKIMEIPLIDHIIIGDNKYYSFKEASLIN